MNDPLLTLGLFDISNPSNNYSAGFYPTFIRFSNGVGHGFAPVSSVNNSDIVPDVRGMALKILGVGGPKLNQPSKFNLVSNF